MIKLDRLLKEFKPLLPGLLVLAVVLGCGYFTRNFGEPVAGAVAVRSAE